MLRCIIMPIISGILLTSSASAASLGNILCLGDSITRGTVAGGYRQRLFDDLVAADYSFRFVGTQTNYATGTLSSANQDHHEGHGSYTIGMIDSNLNGWLATIPTPQYVLLEIGTNDFSSTYYGTGNVINRLNTLISHITAELPNAYLIVSNLTPRTEAGWDAKIDTEYNPFVPGLVESYGNRVSFLDMASVINVADLADNVHPTQGGYNNMGDAWYGAIIAVPEPSTLLLLCIAAGWLLYHRRKQLFPVGILLATRRS